MPHENWKGSIHYYYEVLSMGSEYKEPSEIGVLSEIGLFTVPHSFGEGAKVFLAN